MPTNIAGTIFAALIAVNLFAYFVLGVNFWLLVVGLFFSSVVLLAIKAVHAKRRFWQGDQPHTQSIVHVDTHMALRPTVLKHRVPDGYRLACLYFGTGLIDRTETLDQGFPYKVLDRIPPATERITSFEALCDTRARSIVADARRRNFGINCLWSGGIDSTTACIALMRALDDPKLLTVYLSRESVAEYPAFFKKHIKGKVRYKWISDVGRAYRDQGVVVTGELGDQMFGSAKALAVPLRSPEHPRAEPFPGPLRRPWQDELPKILEANLASAARAKIVTDYLTPQIELAPVAIPDLFTCLWWMNFSLKWQNVSLRMLPSTGLSLLEFQGRTRHFFQTDDFQRWALAHAGQGLRDGWETYKWPARDYIFAFTNDAEYRNNKAKLPSLRGMMNPQVALAALAIDSGGSLLWQERDQTLREPLTAAGESGVSVEFGVSFESKREEPLWDDLGDGE